LPPLERPANLAGKAYFTEQDAAEYEKRTVSQNTGNRRDGGPDPDIGRSSRRPLRQWDKDEYWRAIAEGIQATIKRRRRRPRPAGAHTTA
jgi:hypothetical protein